MIRCSAPASPCPQSGQVPHMLAGHSTPSWILRPAAWCCAAALPPSPSRARISRRLSEQARPNAPCWRSPLVIAHMAAPRSRCGSVMHPAHHPRPGDSAPAVHHTHSSTGFPHCSHLPGKRSRSWLLRRPAPPRSPPDRARATWKASVNRAPRRSSHSLPLVVIHLRAADLFLLHRAASAPCLAIHAAA